MSSCGRDNCDNCSDQSQTFTGYIEESGHSSSSSSSSSRSPSSSSSSNTCFTGGYPYSGQSEDYRRRPRETEHYCVPISTHTRVIGRKNEHIKHIPSRYIANSPILQTSSIQPIPDVPINTVPITFSASASGVISFQWPTFSGTCGITGIGYVSFGQPFSHLPAYNIIIPISLSFKGSYKTGMFVIDRTGDQLYGGSPGIKLFFFENFSGASVTSGDAFTISGSCVQWMSKELC